MSAEAPWTIKRVLAWTTGFFKEKGLDSARLDAELIIADALNITRIQIYTDHERPLHPEELTAIRDRVRRRARHEPVAYIVGSRGFRDLDLAVDPRVLIPRPETELLVDVALARLSGVADPVVVDVGTGSGAIALSIAQARPDARVVAVDTSPEALAVARENAKRNEVTNVEFVHGDLLADVGGPVHLVASNPPYIPSADIDGLMPDVRDFEPRLALDGGPDGLDVIRRLIPAAASRLAPGGALVMEIGHDQGDALRHLLASWSDVHVHADLAGLDRVVEATRP
jgi:release factor glutamine methyltransferase